MPGVGGYGRRDGLEFQLPSGHIEIAGAGWVHMQIDTLLPHCRYMPATWLTDTVRQLLIAYMQHTNFRLQFKQMLLVIVEHSDVDGRHVFDQDNKGWKAVSNACIFNNFNVVDYEWLEQKTYPPRQLNRVKSIKGDVLVTFRKNPAPVHLRVCDDSQFIRIITEFITETIKKGTTDTNAIMMAIMEWILRNMIIIGNVDVFTVLNNCFQLDKEGNWSIKQK